jgi:hypothetical protein
MKVNTPISKKKKATFGILVLFFIFLLTFVVGEVGIRLLRSYDNDGNFFILSNVLENIEKWSLVKYEYFYKPENYQNHIWLKGKLISYILDVISINRFNILEKERSFYSLSKEPAKLTLNILEKFKNDVENNNGRFYIVHLPKYSDLSVLLDNKELAYIELLKKIEQNNEVIHPEYKMLEEANSSSIDSLFVNHYSAKGNKIVADVIAKVIIEHKKELYKVSKFK